MDEVRLTRRQVLQGGSALGLSFLLGFDVKKAFGANATTFQPNAFLEIRPDNRIRVLCKHAEIGQGCFTGLATLLAEELGANWEDVEVEAAASDAKRYANLLWGIQGTGGSTAMKNSWKQYREAGAAAREMLRAAAARTWERPVREITIEGGRAHHAPTGKSLSFGELTQAAQAEKVPEKVSLKGPAEFQLIGSSIPRLDIEAKARGQTQFAMDVDLPNRVVAMLVRPPRFGGTLPPVDATKARALPGVVDVLETSVGVAVLAEDTWTAKRARDALVFAAPRKDAQAEARDEAKILADFHSLAETAGTKVTRKGDATQALAKAKKKLAVRFEFPYLAHAPMEPLNATLQFRDGEADVYSGSQLQTLDQNVVAQVLGIPPTKVRIHSLYAGGSFGRRATPDADLCRELATIAKAWGKDRPVHLVWTREDDLQGGKYRPLSVHHVEVGMNEEGNISGWKHTLVSQSLLAGTPFAGGIKDGVDHSSVEGVAHPAYAIPDLSVDLHSPSFPVSVLWWRSVGHTSNAFVMETLMDELAYLAHEDPVDFRLRHLAPESKETQTLLLATQKAGYGKQLPPGRAHGVAVHSSFDSTVAQIAEVSRCPHGEPKVHKVVAAIHCGTAINPDVIRAQIESGIGYGLGAALYNRIRIEGGASMDKNFDSYRPLRIQEMPEIEVHILPSNDPPTGVGEPGVPPIAPAVANAWFQISGTRVRSLPFVNSGPHRKDA